MSGDPQNLPSPLKLWALHLLITLKTYLHPEGLGRGDRRETPRRKADRRRERIQRFWLIVVTIVVAWGFLSIRHNQQVGADARYDGTRQRCELVKTIIQTAVDLGVPSQSKNLQRLRVNLTQCRILEAKGRKEAGE